MVQIKAKKEAGEVMEMMGYTLTEEANKRMEEGDMSETVRRLHTIGREMIEHGRDVQDEPENGEDDSLFEDSLYVIE